MELSLRDMPFGMGRGCGRAGEPRRHRRRRKLAPGSSTTDHQRVTLAENDDVLNVFGCGRLVAGIGFLRLPASSTLGVTGVLTYPRKPGAA